MPTNRSANIFRNIMLLLERDFPLIEIYCEHPPGSAHGEGCSRWTVRLHCEADGSCADCPEVQVEDADRFTAVLVAWRESVYLEDAGGALAPYICENPNAQPA